MDETEEKCFICTAKSRTAQGSAEIASSDGLALAIPFRAPQFPGHTVIAPAAHHDLEDVTDAEWVAIGQLARQASRRHRSQDPQTEKCYLVAIGDVDRGHLHFHLLPKRHDDPSLGPFVFGDAGWVNADS